MKKKPSIISGLQHVFRRTNQRIDMLKRHLRNHQNNQFLLYRRDVTDAGVLLFYQRRSLPFYSTFLDVSR